MDITQLLQNISCKLDLLLHDTLDDFYCEGNIDIPNYNLKDRICNVVFILVKHSIALDNGGEKCIISIEIESQLISIGFKRVYVNAN